MEKELKSCTGVLLSADLTGHGNPSPFCQKWWDGRALLGQPEISPWVSPQKDTRAGFQFFFHNVLLHY